MRESDNIKKEISKYKLSTILHFSSAVIMTGFSTYGAITAGKNFAKAISEDNFNMMGIGHGIFSVIFAASTIYAGVCAYQEIKNYKQMMSQLNDYAEEKKSQPKVLKRQ